MKTPRLITIAIHVPDLVSDQQVADTTYAWLRYAMRPREGEVTPDLASLEVHARSLTTEEDERERAWIAGGAR